MTGDFSIMTSRMTVIQVESNLQGRKYQIILKLTLILKNEYTINNKFRIF